MWTAIISFFGGLSGTILAYALGASLVFSGGAYVGYRWEEGTLEARVAADAQAVTVVVQKAVSRQTAESIADVKAAVADSQAQAQIITKTVTLTQKVPIYVTQTVDHPCLPVGLIRLLDAAVSEADPASLQLAPGQSDDTCADIDVDTLADQIIAWISVDQGNAQQLTDLQAWVKADHAAQEANQ